MEGNDIFCTQFEEWKEKGLIIHNNFLTYSILCIEPSVPGHALVIPRNHEEKLKGIEGYAERFFSGMEGTFQYIQRMYEENPEAIVGFYESLLKSPKQSSRECAERMLRHPGLRVKPEAYNFGMNVGYFAGQRVNHVHFHLFPRREGESGLGIATAMKNYLSRD
jgi:diadenosine tetraphosphate (Ap4A) HIT family hydrolase